MYEINVRLFFLSWNIVSAFSLSSRDVCDKNDDQCLHFNLLKSGKIVFDKCLKNHVLLRLQDISFLACMKSCIRTSKCTSVNYRKNWHLCDINEASNDVISDEKECMYTEISQWTNTIGGKCARHDCKSGTKCTGKHKNGTYQCTRAYCIGDPKVGRALVVEKFGIYRNLGQAVQYNCAKGLKMTGRPFAVCEKTGSWKTLFACGDVQMVSAKKRAHLIAPFKREEPSLFPASNGVDGNKKNFFHTDRLTNPSWWVDLGANYIVVRVVVTNRYDPDTGKRLKELIVYVGSTLSNNDMTECGRFRGPGTDGQTIEIKCTDYPEGKYVKLVNRAENAYLHLAEVEVFGVLLSTD